MRNTITVLSFLLLSCFIYAQNDFCANAIVLTPSNTCVFTAGTFSGATITSPSPSCAPNAVQDVWYQFVATDPTMSVFLSASGGLNHGFEILRASCDGLTVVCVNNNNSGTSETNLSNNYVVGETYYIRVLNVAGNLSLAGFEICIQSFPTPGNDSCANATLLSASSNCVFTTGSFSGSSISSTAPSCAPNAVQDVWYRFVATDPTMSVFLSASGGLNHGFEILRASCDGSTVVCVNNNNSGTSETNLSNNYVVGETYYVRVLNVAGNLSLASFEICIQSFPTPANDSCANATNLIPSASCITLPVTFTGSGTVGAAPSCAPNSSQDVWYKFTAPLSSLFVQLTAASGVNHGFEVYEGSCDGSVITCMNNFNSGTGESASFTTLTAGTTYYVRVFNFSQGLSMGTFGICAFNSVLNTADFAFTDLQLYPNPVAETLYLDQIPLDGAYYFIFNQMGQKIMEGGLKQHAIIVTDLTSGIYFVKILAENGKSEVAKKFIKL